MLINFAEESICLNNSEKESTSPDITTDGMSLVMYSIIYLAINALIDSVELSNVSVGGKTKTTGIY